MKFIKFNSTVEPIDHKTKLYIYSYCKTYRHKYRQRKKNKYQGIPNGLIRCFKFNY